MQLTAGARLRASLVNLTNDLLGRMPVSQASPDVAFGRVLFRPPFEQGWKALFRRGGRPIELRGQVIHPSFHQPTAGIGIKFRVGIEAAHARWKTGAPDPKWTDAKPHPR